MLPDGWRPLLKGERLHEGDEWANQLAKLQFTPWDKEQMSDLLLGCFYRTRRSFPELVPLEASILTEVQRATAKFPTWPNDPIHAASVVMEEAGELSKACNEHMYEPQKSSLDDVRKEAIQTAAMAIRFLMSLDRYDWTKGTQHEQPCSKLKGAQP
jgi:NTP pyrophosphatase (non-canonical NTP hydrolase)